MNSPIVAEMVGTRMQIARTRPVELLQLFHDTRPLVSADFPFGAFLQRALNTVGNRLEGATSQGAFRTP